MPKCLVKFCKNRKGFAKGVAFYTLTKQRYELWMKALEHFTRDSFFSVGGKKILKKGAVPTLKLKPEKYNLTWQSRRRDEILIINMEEPSTSNNLGMSSKNSIERNSIVDLNIDADEVPTSTSKKRKFLDRIEKTSTTDNESLDGSQERRKSYLKTFHNYRYEEEDENSLLQEDVKDVELFESMESLDQEEVLSERCEPSSIIQEANQALIVEELRDIKNVLSEHCEGNTQMMTQTTAMREKTLKCLDQVVKTQKRTLEMEEKKIAQQNQVIHQMKIQNYLLRKFLEKLG